MAKKITSTEIITSVPITKNAKGKVIVIFTEAANAKTGSEDEVTPELAQTLIKLGYAKLK